MNIFPSLLECEILKRYLREQGVDWILHRLEYLLRLVLLVWWLVYLQALVGMKCLPKNRQLKKR